VTPDLHASLVARANGRCECGCGRAVPPGEVDHFFGRAKAPENEFTCWVLAVGCHRAKTDNEPARKVWLMLFIRHCGRKQWAAESADVATGFAAAAAEALKKLEWLTAKGAVT